MHSPAPIERNETAPPILPGQRTCEIRGDFRGSGCAWYGEPVCSGGARGIRTRRTALIPDFPNKWPESKVESTARRPTQYRSNLVSAENLLKTGIFADLAGDFRQLAPQDLGIGCLETKTNARKAGISGPISRFLGSLAKRWNAWLGREDSNLRMVESKSGYFINDFNEFSDQTAFLPPR
jgi:hypothetical protein